MNVLIYCNTHYQLLMAFQIAFTIYRNSEVDIVVTDHIVNGGIIASNLRKTNLFREVFFFSTMRISKRDNRMKGIADIFFYGFGMSNINLPHLYSEIVIYNFDISTYDLLNFQEKKMPNCIWSKMEEGIFSYNTDFYLSGNRYKAISFFRKLRKKKDERTLFKRYYCSFPELKRIHQEWDTIKIPPLNVDLNSSIDFVTSVYKPKNYFFDQKYIFFASSGNVDGYNLNELELLSEIAKNVGKNNIIIKKHPRDTTEVFEKAGFRVWKDNATPWEVLHLINSFEDKIFLTVSSGAFINSSAWLGYANKGLFLYPEVKKTPKEVAEYISRIDELLICLHERHLCMEIVKGYIKDISEYEQYQKT